MDFLSAMKKADPRGRASMPGISLTLFSHWETKILEIFLKAYAVEKHLSLTVTSNGFGSLWLDLQKESHVSEKSVSPLVVILDDGLFVSASQLRSDAILDRSKINEELARAPEKIRECAEMLSRIAENRPLIVIPLLLPAYPLLYTPAFCESKMQSLRHHWRAALGDLQISEPRVTVLDDEQLWHELPPAQRLDDRLLFTGGWPLNMIATDRLAFVLAKQLSPKESRKLLISDADMTLWSGIAGDDGVEAISWDQEAPSYRHFIYQKTLNLLLSEGVLVAIASRNSPETLQSALERPDLVLNRKDLVAQVASWSSKSEMISQILKKTNLLPNAVVFVDDSQFELGEVQNVFPEIKCFQFPADNLGLRQFISELRGEFDTRVVTEEDKVRASSIQHAAAFAKERNSAHSPEGYLKSLGMKARVERIDPCSSDRAFQLINKTNQFNLSGKRYTAEEWQKYLLSGGVTGYQLSFWDDVSQYGIVSVLLLDRSGKISDWVLSCRVFGRTIEHFFLNFALEEIRKHGVQRMELSYAKTPGNLPVLEFLKQSLKLNGQDCLYHCDQTLKTFVTEEKSAGCSAA